MAGGRHPPKDLRALARARGVDLDEALARLKELYADVDARNERNTRGLELPCARGCSACCEESVFLTRLEFYGAWDHLQTHVDEATLDVIVDEGLALYARHRELIDAFERPPPAGSDDHTAIAVELKFRCPLLSPDGACRVYPMREILGRLFGCSFNDASGIYGCHLVGRHLAGRTLTLVKARPMASRVHLLPLGERQQVYPYWIQELYGEH